ncbi:L-lysine-aminomutase [Xylaria palmicola]|nr:L-lysine-aminomutase [Xylaria palmicola]
MPPIASHRLRSLRRPTMPKSTASLRLKMIRNLSAISSPATLELVGDSLSAIGVPWVSTTSGVEEPEFWRNVAPYRDVTRDQFLSWRWNTGNVVEIKRKLWEFIYDAVPNEIPRPRFIAGMQTRDEFMGDIHGGMKDAGMSVRLTPTVLSQINWRDPTNCPIFRQFVPLRSIMVQDHPYVKLDSLNERQDSPVDLVIHRYPDKAIILPISICPVYCAHCTREHLVGANTALVVKEPVRSSKEKLENAFSYIEGQENLRDIVISGGDAFYIHPEVASKGLAVCPQRFLDERDPWTHQLIRISDKARRAGKHFALHTHFNHPDEISWITEKAALKLMQAGVTVRNQTVLLRGVNDDVPTMSSLIRKLARMTIQPYYVYQCDMVPGIEHLRTPLQTILDLESELRGSIAGFYMPNCVVDLPGGGGKRLACSFDSYDRETGESTFRAPVLTSGEKKGKIYKYYDPLRTTYFV